jgi:hypothetical protein
VKWSRENHPTNGGRPRGSKNRLARRVLEDLLAIWDEPISEGKSTTRGQAALRIMSRERPNEFAKLYAGILPRELTIETVAAELGDDELGEMIEMLRERVALAVREEPMKLIEAVNGRDKAPA